MSLELTAVTAPLAEAAARLVRLLPARSLHASPATVLLSADAGGLTLAASDAELSVRVHASATVHTDGAVVVARRAFADTVAALDAPEVRLAVEGSRLAIRTGGGRFALPCLDAATHPSPAGEPPLAGTVSGAALGVGTAVAGAASRDGALPIFTGVRVRAEGDRLAFVATDRYRMAAASIPWQPGPMAGGAWTERRADEVGARREGRQRLSGPGARVSGASADQHGPGPAGLVPGALFAEVCRQASRADEVRVYASGDRFGLAWQGCTVVAASLAGPFPDRQLDALLDVRAECVVELGADELAAAVQRALPYAGPHGRVTLRASDGVLQVSGRDPQSGESEEAVKASVRGDHLSAHYQARFVLDALRPFAGGPVTVSVQEAMRATAFTAPESALTYLVVPMRA
ncbi:DNA polymerase III subunit beta [Phytohabitans aurantiacus]|uniref:DNA polymerase III subunit beta n=1 Tax=Phytohabitans aurantiacus TaxID=3016789 RepID=A0ABQ5R8H2_9ACTN|nr:DNA polymerase III subunit beta [Phytohabitans aurantiacus]GLI02683.1 DNA polymerase III subunit beta [Phytohabitans aurantiacus]